MQARQGAAIKERKTNPMRAKLAIMIAGAGALLVMAVVPAWAHHAFAAEFDSNQPVKFRGVVTRMEWTNPHVWIHLDVKQPDGTVEKWSVEAGTPNVLFRRGFTKDALKAGTEILVDGYRSKDGTRRANGRDLTLPDGRVLFLGGSSPDAPK